jgi:hypothetical protein
MQKEEEEVEVEEEEDDHFSMVNWRSVCDLLDEKFC